MIDQSFLMNLLNEAAKSNSIEGHIFESRFEEKPYDNDPASSFFLIGICHEETRKELRDRDRHLLFAREAGLVRFDTAPYDGRDEYFGSPVFVTPLGYNKLSPAKHSLKSTFAYLFEQVGWPLIVVILGLIITALFGFS